MRRARTGAAAVLELKGCRRAGANIHGRPNLDPEFLFEGTLRGKEEAAIPLLSLLAAQLVCLVFVAKRFHDLDKSALYIFGMLVPLYNLYLGIILLFQKGTTGPNRFGPDPLARQIGA